MDKSIIIGWDHAGFPLANALVPSLSKEYSISSIGPSSSAEKADYPLIATQVVREVLHKNATGILICGTGIGMSIAANRHHGIRAALCHDYTSTFLSRSHNNANILVLGARLVGEAIAFDCVSVFLSTPFSAGRHQARIDMF